jgi:hypothetical protein
VGAKAASLTLGGVRRCVVKIVKELLPHARQDKVVREADTHRVEVVAAKESHVPTRICAQWRMLSMLARAGRSTAQLRRTRARTVNVQPADQAALVCSVLVVLCDWFIHLVQITILLFEVSVPQNISRLFEPVPVWCAHSVSNVNFARS